ncbi:T9SS type A sorting domain-containing protein [Chitinivibrio alkaliphilus]|uniref:Uncharacterized protein n=1 Tax=Chitinivibrio alkaliphilus ACht1 TaxID=1313304 RepID=U7D2H9_9BACT|nr:T9SS type A sorting domain-containing protein [Chitinivibrio alkaliphilus]ERP30709.1 hypothetical protein CALK_2472 [Chitinivibrio alkaliphilus ACht1]
MRSMVLSLCLISCVLARPELVSSIDYYDQDVYIGIARTPLSANNNVYAAILTSETLRIIDRTTGETIATQEIPGYTISENTYSVTATQHWFNSKSTWEIIDASYSDEEGYSFRVIDSHGTILMEEPGAPTLFVDNKGTPHMVSTNTSPNKTWRLQRSTAHINESQEPQNGLKGVQYSAGDDKFTLNTHQDGVLHIYAPTGRRVYQSEPGDLTSGSHTVNLESFSSGVYIPVVHTKQGVHSTRFVR